MKALRRLLGITRKLAPEAMGEASATLSPVAAGTGLRTSRSSGNRAPESLPHDGLTPSNVLQNVSGVRNMPRPALRWVGAAGRIALREFDFAADADAICGLQEETYSLNFPDFRYTDSFAAAFRHDLRRAALDPHHGIFVLDGGTICGFLWLVVCENTWTGERYGYVNNLYLAPQWRGAGLAGELMAQTDHWFKSRHIRRVRLTVTTSNEAACRLYERCGYEVTRWEMEKTI